MKEFYDSQNGIRFLNTETIKYNEFNPEYKDKYIRADRVLVEYTVLGFPISDEYIVHHRFNIQDNNEMRDLFLLTKQENEQVNDLLDSLDEPEIAILGALYELIQEVSMGNVAKLKLQNFFKCGTKEEFVERVQFPLTKKQNKAPYLTMDLVDPDTICVEKI